MPSFLVGNVSGGDPLFSGTALWSGNTKPPVGGVTLKWDRTASGAAYVSLSGGLRIQSGGWAIGTSGLQSGLLDGIQMSPGDKLFIPRALCPLPSGTLNIFVGCDAAASGQGRIYWESDVVFM